MTHDRHDPWPTWPMTDMINDRLDPWPTHDRHDSWPTWSMTDMTHDRHDPWPTWSMTDMINDRLDPWPTWLTTDMTHDRHDQWPTWPMTDMTHDRHDPWPSDLVSWTTNSATLRPELPPVSVPHTFLSLARVRRGWKNCQNNNNKSSNDLWCFDTYNCTTHNKMTHCNNGVDEDGSSISCTAFHWCTH